MQCRSKEENGTDRELLSDNTTVRCSNGQKSLLGVLSRAQLTCLAMAAGHHHLPVDLTRPTEAAQTAGDRTLHHTTPGSPGSSPFVGNPLIRSDTHLRAEETPPTRDKMCYVHVGQSRRHWRGGGVVSRASPYLGIEVIVQSRFTIVQ